MKRQRAKGYVGTGHETIGSDILSILEVVTMPEQILGKEMSDKLRAVKSDQWYPIDLMLEPMELLAERIGYAGLVQMGRALFRRTHEAAVRAMASSVGDIVFALDGMYHSANRGQEIGGWKVTSFVPGRATLEKTSPHPCWMEEGIIAEACRSIGIPAFVNQSSCVLQGGELCSYVLSSLVRDTRWSGKHASIAEPLP